MYSILQQMRALNFYSMMLRIILAILVGGLVGFERERKGRAAGFRTYILVAMGASMTVMLGQYLDLMMNSFWADQAEAINVHTDVSRFAAQVINGVGFLGAGTIIVTGHQEVRGLTTAAGLWASACIGIACGAGFYECVFVGVVLILMCMWMLPCFEEFIVSRSRNMNIYIDLDSFENMAEIVNQLKREGIYIFDLDIEKDNQEHMGKFSILFSVHLPKNLPHAEALALLSKTEGIIAIYEA